MMEETEIVCEISPLVSYCGEVSECGKWMTLFLNILSCRILKVFAGVSSTVHQCTSRMESSACIIMCSQVVLFKHEQSEFCFVRFL